MQEGPDPRTVTLQEGKNILNESRQKNTVQETGQSPTALLNPDGRVSLKAMIFAFSFCADTFVFDRLTKWLVMHNKIATQEIVSGLIAITKHNNYGLLGDTVVPAYLMYGLNALAFTTLIYAIFNHLRHNEPYKMIALMAVFGGALGNLYDRLIFGYVFDWLMFFNTSIVNLADVFIALGLLIYAWLAMRKRSAPIAS